MRMMLVDCVMCPVVQADNETASSPGDNVAAPWRGLQGRGRGDKNNVTPRRAICSIDIPFSLS